MARKYKRNMARLRHTQGCLTDCVAYYFNLHPENVPYFVYPRKGWNARLKSFFKKRGYRAFWVQAPFVPRGKMHIVCGDSLKWKTATHVVVYKNGKLAYDPNYPSDWKDSRITHRLFIQKV